MLARIQPILVGHPVDLAPLPTTSHDDDQVQVDPPLAQHGLRQLRGPGSNLGQTTRRRGHGGRPRRPRPSQPCGCRPTPRPRPHSALDTADAATHGHRTPDAGGRTVDTWTLRRPHRTPVTWTGPVEHRTLAPDAGHRMPDTNADTVTTAQPASGPPWPPRERPHAETPNRACALALPAGCSAAPPAKPRPGALLSSDDFGSSVERAAKLHPLWQGARRDRHQLEQARSGFDQGVVSELRAVYSGVRCAGVGWRRRGE